MGRFRAYALVSTAAAGAVVYYAWSTRLQFYTTVIYLVTSKLSIAVLGNFALLVLLLLTRGFTRLFLGKLSLNEVERVEDNLRFAIPETCLALTIFREELSVRVVSLFATVLVSKFFHWVCECRVEHLETAAVGSVSRRDHARLTTLLALLLLGDAAALSIFGLLTVERGPSVLILFGFEYALMAITVLSTMGRYVLHVIGRRIEAAAAAEAEAAEAAAEAAAAAAAARADEGGDGGDGAAAPAPPPAPRPAPGGAHAGVNGGRWVNRTMYVMYVDLLSDLVRLFVYLLYFMIIFTFYGMPLPIIRDLWTSFANLNRRLKQFIEYRRITRTMHERYPDATQEELAGATCIICREDNMTEAKKLPLPSAAPGPEEIVAEDPSATESSFAQQRAEALRRRRAAYYSKSRDDETGKAAEEGDGK